MKYVIVFAAIAAALFCRMFLVAVYKVPSQKMAPTILAGDLIIASKVSYGVVVPWSDDLYFRAKPKRGELVVFIKDSKIFIKRVMAGPLDEVAFINGEYWINSIKCEYNMAEKSENLGYGIYEEKCGNSSRKIIKPIEVNKSVQMAKIKVEGFLVANDYRNYEIDINSAENISPDQIIGKPLFIWMSYSSTQDFISKTLGIRWNRILTKLQ